MTLTREQVEQQRDDGRVVIIKLGAENAALRQRVDELERDQHKPTVTYWMNQFTLMQQEAKKRFDDWFVLRQQVDDLTAKLAKVEQSREEWKAGWYALSHDSGQQLEALTARIRTSTQLIIETIGSCGPEDLEEAIGRIVARVADLTAKLAALTPRRTR